MVHVVIDRCFSLFLKALKIFHNPRLLLIAPLTYRSLMQHLQSTYFSYQTLFWKRLGIPLETTVKRREKKKSNHDKQNGVHSCYVYECNQYKFTVINGAQLGKMKKSILDRSLP